MFPSSFSPDHDRCHSRVTARRWFLPVVRLRMSPSHPIPPTVPSRRSWSSTRWLAAFS